MLVELNYRCGELVLWTSFALSTRLLSLRRRWAGPGIDPRRAAALSYSLIPHLARPARYRSHSRNDGRRHTLLFPKSTTTPLRQHATPPWHEASRRNDICFIFCFRSSVHSPDGCRPKRWRSTDFGASDARGWPSFLSSCQLASNINPLYNNRLHLTVYYTVRKEGLLTLI